MESIINSAWFAALLGILGVLLGSAVAVSWAHKNGEALGRRVGRWLPGDQVEGWLVEFLVGLKEGLEETMTPKTVEMTPNDQTGQNWQLSIKPNPTILTRNTK